MSLCLNVVLVQYSHFDLLMFGLVLLQSWEDELSNFNETNI